MKFHEALKSLVGDHQSKAVAKDIGISESTLSQWLTGSQPCGDQYIAKFIEKFYHGDEEAKKREFIRLLVLKLRSGIPDSLDSKWDNLRLLDFSKSALDELVEEASRAVRPTGRTTGRTLADFPESFYPLAIVVGDKREDSETRITAGDFGAVAASPAEGRYLMQLRLRHDVQLYTDKVFVLESIEELRKRFGQTNLLIIGSPGSNHLCRRLHLREAPDVGWRRGAPFFRFNVGDGILKDIEDFLAKTKGLNPKQLVGRQGDPDTYRDLRFRLRQLFGKGITDPCNQGLWLRAVESHPTRDFGLVTLARNPFADSDRYVCLIAAGYHMFATAHAVQFLADPKRFENHPLGGVIRVDMDLTLPFALRFDRSSASWDDELETTNKSDSGRPRGGYSIRELQKGLEELIVSLESTRPPRDLHLSRDEVRETIDFLGHL